MIHMSFLFIYKNRVFKKKNVALFSHSIGLAQPLTHTHNVCGHADAPGVGVVVRNYDHGRVYDTVLSLQLYVIDLLFCNYCITCTGGRIKAGYKMNSNTARHVDKAG